MTNQISLEINECVSFADGYEFDGAGTYERLAGRAHFAVDPKAPANAGICDIDKAPVNGDGLVEFASDIFIYRPVDPAKANKRVFYDYGNREKSYNNRIVSVNLQLLHVNLSQPQLTYNYNTLTSANLS